MIAALPTGSSSDDVFGFVALALLVAAIPVHVWRQKRRRARQLTLVGQVADASQLMALGRFTEAEQCWRVVDVRRRPKRPGEQALVLFVGWQVAVTRSSRGLAAEADFEALLAAYGPERYPERRDSWVAAGGLPGSW